VICGKGRVFILKIVRIKKEKKIFFFLKEIAAHRKKLGSGVMAVAFHPSRQMIGSAGADGLAKVFKNFFLIFLTSLSSKKFFIK
jgi:hypothetical protein